MAPHNHPLTVIILMMSCTIGASAELAQSVILPMKNRNIGKFPHNLAMEGGGVPGQTHDTKERELSWLFEESKRLDTLKGAVYAYLSSKKICIAGALATAPAAVDSPQLRLIQSSVENNINCRVSLTQVPAGETAVAPCRCSGTNEWIQLSVYNRMRRSDPDQWRTCRTCGSPFADMKVLQEGAGIPERAVSLLLDNPGGLRVLAAAVILRLVKKMVGSVALRKVLVSQSLWMQYPSWSRITHLPLPMKLFLLKMLGQQAWLLYLLAEKRFVVELADLETSFIDSREPDENQDEGSNM